MLNKSLCIFGAVIALLLGGCATQPPLTQEQRTNPALYGKKPTPEYVEKVVMFGFSNLLKDPASASYRFNHAYTQRFAVWDDQENRYRFGYIAEFFINAKNSYGGYTGFKPHRMFFDQGKTPLAYVEPYPAGNWPEDYQLATLSSHWWRLEYDR